MKTNPNTQTGKATALSKLKAFRPSRNVLSFGLSMAVATMFSSQSHAAVIPASGTNGDVVVDSGTDGAHTYDLDGHGRYAEKEIMLRNRSISAQSSQLPREVWLTHWPDRPIHQP